MMRRGWIFKRVGCGSHVHRTVRATYRCTETGDRASAGLDRVVLTGLDRVV